MAEEPCGAGVLATDVSTVILTGCFGRRATGRGGLAGAGLTSVCCGGLALVTATLLDSLDVSLARAAAAAAARDADRADIALGSWWRVVGRLRWEQRSFYSDDGEKVCVVLQSQVVCPEFDCL